MSDIIRKYVNEEATLEDVLKEGISPLDIDLGYNNIAEGIKRAIRNGLINDVDSPDIALDQPSAVDAKIEVSFSVPPDESESGSANEHLIQAEIIKAEGVKSLDITVKFLYIPAVGSTASAIEDTMRPDDIEGINRIARSFVEQVEDELGVNITG